MSSEPGPRADADSHTSKSSRKAVFISYASEDAAADGRIAFTVAQGEHTALYVMRSDGAHPSIVTDAFALRGNAARAPDAKSIVVAALHEGEPRLMSFNPAGGPPVPLVYEHSIDPVWSP